MWLAKKFVLPSLSLGGWGSMISVFHFIVHSLHQLSVNGGLTSGLSYDHVPVLMI